MFSKKFQVTSLHGMPDNPVASRNTGKVPVHIFEDVFEDRGSINEWGVNGESVGFACPRCCAVHPIHACALLRGTTRMGKWATVNLRALLCHVHRYSAPPSKSEIALPGSGS